MTITSPKAIAVRMKKAVLLVAIFQSVISGEIY